VEVNRLRYNNLKEERVGIKVLVDTSFIMGIAQRTIKDISSIEIEVGKIDFLIPDVVLNELRLMASKHDKKGRLAKLALEIAENWSKLNTSYKLNNVDEVIERVAKEHGFIVATLDSKLKRRLIRKGIQIITLRQRSRLVLLP
jgi:hypothetical protein